MASTTSGTESPIPAPKRSLWQCIFLYIKLRLVKALVTVALKIFSLPGIRDAAGQPNYKKVYPSRPSLTNRVFIPKSYRTGDVLPLYIDIHGGGFALCCPVVDDPFCSRIANNNKVIVISLDYPKAPSHPYPAAIEALTDLIKAVLNDATLPFDKKKVAIGGFSAGANLALAVVQNKSVRDKVGGVVAFYPALDFVAKGPEKMKTRPAGGPPDPLENLVSMFNYGYVPRGQDLRDPMLSPLYAERDKLPQNLCVFGCEFDMLCREAELFAEKMAGVGSGERTGSDILWEKNNVRWEKILGESHGFDQMIVHGEEKIRTHKRRNKMWGDAADWLFREVYI